MARLPRTGEVGAALVAVLVARTAVNGGMRVVYPFLPEIARGLGVSLSAIGALVALRALAGVTAPVVARLAETHGRRQLMLAAAAGTAASGLVVALAGGAPLRGWLPFAVAGAGFLLAGLAKPTFDVPMQAWFGERVPYERRGRILGTTELTWALSLLATVPLSGFLIAATSWQAPFLLVAVYAVVGAVVVRRLIAPDRPHERIRRPLRHSPAQVRMLALILLFSVASEMLFVVYGAWLEDDFGLSVAAIGVFTLVLVGSELAGEGGVAAFADRIGLRRSILGGLLVSAAAYAAFGGVGGSLVAAVAVVVVWLTAYETTIVATVPFVSELAPGARDRLLSLMAAVIAVGRGAGALVAGPVYTAGGIAASGLVAAGCVLVAAALLLTVPSPASPLGTDLQLPGADRPGGPSPPAGGDAVRRPGRGQ